jgi:hypothetical protein
VHIPFGHLKGKLIGQLTLGQSIKSLLQDPSAHCRNPNGHPFIVLHSSTVVWHVPSGHLIGVILSHLSGGVQSALLETHFPSQQRIGLFPGQVTSGAQSTGSFLQVLS